MKKLIRKREVKNSVLQNTTQEYSIYYMPEEEKYKEKISLETLLKKVNENRKLQPHSLRFENKKDLEELIEGLCKAWGYMIHPDKTINYNLLSNYYAKIFANFITEGIKERIREEQQLKRVLPPNKNKSFSPSQTY